MGEPKNKPRVCIVSYPQGSMIPYIFISDLMKILEHITASIIVIDSCMENLSVNSEKVELIDIGLKPHRISDANPQLYSKILWLNRFLRIQLRTSLEIVKNRKNMDVVIFYIAYPNNILFPVIAARLCGIKTVEILTRTKNRYTYFSVFNFFYRFQDKVLFHLLDYLSPETPVLIETLELNRFKNKLLPAGARFIDTSTFYPTTKFAERKPIIGFIGRATREKGIFSLIESIPAIFEARPDIEIQIIGEINEDVRERIQGIRQVKPVGWVPHEQLPAYINELKLMVLPTESEGLPTTVLESMACGTPVVTTAVGGIPDIIENGATGYILEDNSPDCIARSVIKALDDRDLPKVSANAIRRVINNYSLQNAILRYDDIIHLKN